MYHTISCQQIAPRTPLSSDGQPVNRKATVLRGVEEHSSTDRRNTGVKGVASAILVRALLSALEGSVIEARRWRATNQVRVAVHPHSKPETAAECWLD